MAFNKGKDRADAQGPDDQASASQGGQADEAGTAEVQARMDAEQEKGFRGIEVDPTPNENYTVSGVTSGAPTPETDDGAAESARQAIADVARRSAGVAKR